MESTKMQNGQITIAAAKAARHIKRMFILFLLSLFVWPLCACGASAAEKEYSETMQAAALSGGWGNGGKIAVYDETAGTYVRDILGEQLLAETPEEVGAILQVSKNGKASSDQKYGLLLTAADGGEILLDRSLPRGSVSQEYFYGQIERVVRPVWEQYLEECEYSQVIQEAAQSDNFGHGSKIAVFDTKKGRYVKDFLGSNQVESPDEIGAILFITKSDHQDSVQTFYDWVLTRAYDGMEISADTDCYNSSPAENAWDQYRYRTIYSSGEFPSGYGIAYYNEEKDIFEGRLPFYEFLLEGYQCRTPEDVGAFLRSGEENGRSVMILCYGEKDSQIIGKRYESEGTKWIREMADFFFSGRDYFLALNGGKPGGGNKIIGFDTDTQLYSTRYIPDELVASSPGETGMIAEIHTETRTETVTYGKNNIPVGVDYECVIDCVTIVLKDAETGEELDHTTIEAAPPESITPNPDKFLPCHVKEGQVEEWMRTAWAARFSAG